MVSINIFWLGRVTNLVQTLMISAGEQTFIPVGKEIMTEASKLSSDNQEDNSAYSEEPDTHSQSEIHAVARYHFDS